LKNKSHNQLTHQNWDIYHFASLASTNQTAKEFLHQGYQLPFVVLADGQTSGQGQYGRTFYSPNQEGLYCTLVVKDNITVPVNLLVPVVVIKALANFNLNGVQIKWVNDLIFQNRKVGGILIERLNIKSESYLLLGIGINLHTHQFPLELQHKAIALQTNIEPLILVKEIINQYQLLDQTQVLENYRQLMSGINTEVDYHNQTFIVVGICDDGALLVKQDDQQQIITFDHSSLVWKGIYD
jgi:BirA family transcriptional regulator, biotin operon repressor / biotin---[acetyl-CoA-carboxylase] ligase